MMSFFVLPTSSKSANPAPRFHQPRPSFLKSCISTRFKWKTQSVPPTPVASVNITQQAQVLKLLEYILKRSIDHIHGIQKNLQYWNAFAEGSDTTYNGVQFKLHEAIPVTEGGVLKFEPDLTTKGISPEISSKIRILMSVRYYLSVFISKVHGELMIIRKGESSADDLLKAVEGYISWLKDSVRSIQEIEKLGHFTFDEPVGDEMPGNAVKRIYGDLNKMDMYLSSLIRLVGNKKVATYRRPSKMLQKLMLFTAGVGVMTLSMWIFNQSGPLGIMDSTVDVIKDFWIDNVKEPFAGLKDELFNKSMKRDMELMEVGEVRLNDESLRRMLLDFIELTTDDRSYANKSNEEILELVAKRYAEQIKLPIRGIFKGDLVQACLIQVQKLKLDFLTEKLLVNKIMRANGLTLAIIAALPTIGVFSLGALSIYQLLKRSECKDRLARRRLLQQIEWRLNESQRQGENDEYLHGLLLYTADSLSKAVEKSAKATHEWNSVREELANLGMKQGAEQDKILKQLKEDYACLLP